MRPIAVACSLAALLAVRAAAVALDLTPQDIERALAIARSSEAERARFHAPYIVALKDPLVERVEVVSEYRRVVLMAEDRALKGDRMFGYSTSMAQKAVAPWNRRVSIIARLRFHPQNTYVDVPPAEVILEGFERARIGVQREPIMSLPSLKPSDRLPVLGAVVEGVFDATLVHDGTRTFLVRLDGKDLARVFFDLGSLQ